MKKIESLFGRIFNVSETAAIMCTVITVLFFILLAIGSGVLFFIYGYEYILPFATAILIGCALSIIKVALIEKSLNKSMDMESEKARSFSSLQTIARHFLTAIILVPIFLFRDFFGYAGINGGILGITSLQISAYIANFILKKRER